MTNHIIAICGPRGSGKSTLALLLRDNYIPTSFASPIKKMLFKLVMSQGEKYDTAYRMFYGDLKNIPSDYFLGKTPRFAMQTLGTEWGRDIIHPNLWAEAWRKRIEKLIENYNVVVDDLRFLTEERAIRTFENTTIVRIDRPGHEPAEHQSESEFLSIQYDVLIKNDTTSDDMFATLQTEMVSPRFINREVRRNETLLR